MEITAGVNIVTGSDPAHEVLQLPQTAFPALAAVWSDGMDTTNGVLITSAATVGLSVLLQGVTKSSLGDQNFRLW